MGFAMAVIAAAKGARGRGAATLAFVMQLMINLAWSPMFFGSHQITGALILIALLDLAVIVTIALFWRIRRSAALLMLPYLAWILFATLLTCQIRQANPESGRTAGLFGRDRPLRVLMRNALKTTAAKAIYTPCKAKTP